MGEEKDKKDREGYEEVEKCGSVNLKDYKESKEVLGPQEDLKLISGVPVKKGKGKNLIVLSDNRVLFCRKGETDLLGGKERLMDFPYGRIAVIKTETRKKYDLIKIETKDGKEEEFMAPKEEGGRIAGFIRDLEHEKKVEDAQETPLEKIDKLSDLKDKGAITQEEFEEKKKDLLKEV